MRQDSEGLYHVIENESLSRSRVEAVIYDLPGLIRLMGCDLEDADLSRLNLTGWHFDRCTLIKANMSYADLSSTIWDGCRSRGAVLRGVDLTDAVVRGGDWNNSDWQGAQLASARLSGLKLTGADMRGARTLGTSYEDCLMQSANLSGMSFRKLALGRCDMGRADLRECDFRDAVFGGGSSLAGALVSKARFEGSDLREADLSGHSIDSMKTLAGARISLAQAAALATAAGLKVG